MLMMAAVLVEERPARGSPSRSASDHSRRSAKKDACLNSGMLRLGEPRAGGFAVLSLQTGWRLLGYDGNSPEYQPIPFVYELLDRELVTHVPVSERSLCRLRLAANAFRSSRGASW